MTEWVWEGRTRTGETRKGVMQADQERDVLLKLRQQNIQPSRVRKKGKALSLPTFGGGVSAAELVVFVRQFATMIDAGLPLVQCLEILGTQEPNKTFKRVILDVKGSVMVSVPEIRSRLQPVFTEPQADLLANVLVETHAELVTRGDFHRLISTVRELADAQKRTEHRVEQLAESQLEMQHAITGLTRQVGDLAKQVGGLSNAVGANLEDFARELVPELLEKY